VGRVGGLEAVADLALDVWGGAAIISRGRRKFKGAQNSLI